MIAIIAAIITNLDIFIFFISNLVLGEGLGEGIFFAIQKVYHKNLYATGYPKNNFVFIQGPVETTIPAPSTPKKIALLRLDTDWYQSTYHELTYLYPRLVKGGVIIIDDYGHWPGARKACDKYFKVNNINILLNRIDYTGRIGIKTKIG